mgnify:CR=1 FL=1
MSAILAVQKEDCVHVLADAAFYDRDGTLTSFHPKVLQVPRANAVFASRGIAMAFPLFAATCREFDYEGFDNFVRNAAEDVFRVMDGVFAREAPGRGYEIVVAGWSEKDGCARTLFHSAISRYDTLPAGPVYLLGERATFGVALDCSAVEFDPQVHGVRAFEDARRTRCDLTCGEGEPVWGHSVGGYLNHAVVSPAGVDWDVLKFWPDTVGEKIKPEGEILEEGWWELEGEGNWTIDDLCRWSNPISALHLQPQ